MKQSTIYMLKKNFAIVLVGVVGLLTLNNVLFTHFHKLANGELIVHAHPFSKSGQTNNPSETHEHTKVELLVFDSLLLLFTGIIIAGTSNLIRPFEIKRLYAAFTVKQNHFRHFSNRAPPIAIH